MERRHVFWLMCLLLLLHTATCPIPLRARRDIPVDFEALAEMPVERPGPEDDYGLLPHHPSIHLRVTRRQSPGLLQAGRSKRDDPDIGELYYNDLI
ncbi:protein Frey 1 [Hyla sarda]|uniref:protein Frey 1 n=1 Tax=Hyla sarda TaxID=327740 RepID=UPI0024C43D40|nr:protein Frey 1 [Hyla sarda]